MDEAVFSAMAEPNQFINAAIRHVRNVSDENWQAQAAEELKQIISERNCDDKIRRVMYADIKRVTACKGISIF